LRQKLVANFRDQDESSPFKISFPVQNANLIFLLLPDQASSGSQDLYLLGLYNGQNFNAIKV
jgi:hypothetical protein